MVVVVPTPRARGRAKGLAKGHFPILMGTLGKPTGAAAPEAVGKGGVAGSEAVDLKVGSWGKPPKRRRKVTQASYKGHSPGARTWAKRLTGVISFNLNTDCYPRSTVRETEAQRGRVPCLGSHSKAAAEPGFKPRSVRCRGLALSAPTRPP